MSSAETAGPRRGGPASPTWPILEWALFAFALLVYVLTRFVGLTRFPIFFFCDEALHGDLVEQLLQNGFRDHTGTFLPPYFLNDQRWAVSLSVYVHLIPLWLFGKSVFVIRATSAAVTLLGAAAVGMTLRTMKNRFWWAAPLVLAVMPVFFLHARTAFESAMMVGFYACFLCAYMLYRYRSPIYLFPALLFGAATFYAYTAGQGVMLVIGPLLFLSDLSYHLRQRKALLVGALLLAVVLALPYVRYRRLHPGVVRQQLEVLHSYWLDPIPLSEKLSRATRTYLDGLDPRYWFFEHEKELERHRIKGKPFFPLAFLPLTAIGIGVCVWNFRRSSAHRMILFSPLGASLSAAAAEIQILRLLAVIVPVALFVGVGLDQVARWIRRLVPHPVVAAVCAAALTVMAFSLTRSALRDGPTWYTDYGLYGMQWGAPQVFEAIREELVKSKETRVILTHTWANNPGAFFPFFLGARERGRVALGSVDPYSAFHLRKQPLSGNELFVMTPNEFEFARQDPKFVVDAPERILPYPDGRPGFYFAHLRYAPNADELFAADREARKKLVEEAVTLDGSPVTVRHSVLDMGSLPALFDGREDTLIRGLEANPFVLEVLFPSPRKVGKVRLKLGTMTVTRIRLLVVPASGLELPESETVYPDRPLDPRIELPVPGGPTSVQMIRLEITDVTAGEVSNVHVFELSFSE